MTKNKFSMETKIKIHFTRLKIIISIREEFHTFILHIFFKYFYSINTITMDLQ